MVKFSIKAGDEVAIISGAHKGKTGTVKKVIREKSRIIVEGVNTLKKAVRKSPQHPNGGIIDIDGTIHISNVKLLTKSAPRKKPQ
jgi:large subunit ribosomal protein L24